MNDSLVYLDTYVLQQDMRIRLPKCVLSNLEAKKGETWFDIFFDSRDSSLVLRVHKEALSEGANANG